MKPSLTSIQATPWTPFAWAGLVFLIVVALMFDTAASVVSIWERSSTFTHGYFILPIFLWLVWRKRGLLATLPSKPDWLPIPLLLGSGMMWLLSGLAGIQVGQHVALVMIIIFSFWAVVGREIASQLKFPLAFLFFLAPVGEELVPHLMEITADFTVGAIRLTGVPIYREGLFFSLPTGNWSVVEACSGIRYLIASMTLGTLYAYLSYDSIQRRLLFVTLSVVVPIVANGIRAFMIVMIGHHSGMTLATGVDHLVYGWLFFGVVMFMLFSLGALFAEPEKKPEPDSQQEEMESPLDSIDGACASTTFAAVTDTTKSARKVAFVMFVAICVGAWPAWTIAMNWSANTTTLSSREMDSILMNSNPTDSETLQGSSSSSTWSPHMSGYDLHLFTSVNSPELPVVEAHAFVYVTQKQGKEMVSSNNVLVRSEDPVWRITSSRLIKVASEVSSYHMVKQSLIESSLNKKLVWQWFSVGSSDTTSPVIAKLLEAKDKLIFRQKPSVTYLLVTDAEHPDAITAIEGASESIRAAL